MGGLQGIWEDEAAQGSVTSKSQNFESKPRIWILIMITMIIIVIIIYYNSNSKSNSKNNNLVQSCKIIGFQWIFRLTSSTKTAT